MRRTMESMVAQTLTPTLWLIVDDGSTDETPQILDEYVQKHDWICVIKKPDRGHRAVGPGVIEAFYFGHNTLDISEFSYLCKLDLDLDLPSTYFEKLIGRLQDTPRIGTCSGKPYARNSRGALVAETAGDEMSVGMTKLFSVACFEDIGGFVHEVMWDGIDCHTARMKGWTPKSWDEEGLRFEHLRPMGSSQTGIYTGRRRHGFGQHYMGSSPMYFIATAISKMRHKPYVLGGLAMLQGFFGAMLKGNRQHGDPELRAFIRNYQRRALLKGKAAVIAEIEDERTSRWIGNRS